MPRLLETDSDAKQHPEDYSFQEVIAHLSFGEEFAARSWAQVSGSRINGRKQRLILTGTVTLH